MAIRYPYTDFHEMNLDWTLQTAKKAGEDSEEALNTANAASEKVDDFIENLDLQEEVDTKINEMSDDGSLNQIIDPVIEQSVSDWLEDNIGPTTPAVDATLTIAGAAADAKATGDRLAQTLGTRSALSNTDDLDTITQMGLYYIPYNDYPDHMPVSAASRLLVIKAADPANSTIISQILFSGNAMYYRVSLNQNINTWSGITWNTVANDTDLADVMQYRGNLTSADDLNDLDVPGLYGVISDNGFPANMPADPLSGKVMVWKVPNQNDYVTAQMYFYHTTAGRYDFKFRSSKSTTTVSAQWTDVEWDTMTTDEKIIGMIHNESKRVRLPLTNAAMQSTGRYSTPVTNRMRTLQTFRNLVNFQCAGYDVKFYYYSSPYDFDEATYTQPVTNFLYSADWVSIAAPKSPELGKWFIPMFRKSDQTSMTADDRAAFQNALYVEKYDQVEEYPVYMQTDVVPPTALDYHALWDDLLYGSDVTRTNLGNVGGDANYPIYLYQIHTQRNWMDGGYQNHTFNGSNEVYPRKKVLMFAGTHGNEKCTPMDVLALARELINGSLRDVGALFDWYIIPITNPWGYGHVHLDSDGKIIYRYGTVASTVTASYATNAGVRTNEQGYDINRDFSDVTYLGSDSLTYGFQSAEGQIMKSFVQSMAWDIFIDVHQNNQDKYDAMSRVGCMMGVAWDNTTDADWLDLEYQTIDQACRNATDALEKYFRRSAASHQTAVIWKRYGAHETGASKGTATNYFGGYTVDGTGNTAHQSIAAKVPMTIETSELAWTYSQLSNQTNTPYVSWYNAVACTCSTTELVNLVKAIAKTYADMTF